MALCLCLKTEDKLLMLFLYGSGSQSPTGVFVGAGWRDWSCLTVPQGPRGFSAYMWDCDGLQEGAGTSCLLWEPVHGCTEHWSLIGASFRSKPEVDSDQHWHSVQLQGGSQRGLRVSRILKTDTTPQVSWSAPWSLQCSRGTNFWDTPLKGKRRISDCPVCCDPLVWGPLSKYGWIDFMDELSVDSV